MNLRNTSTTFGLVAKTLHWVIALGLWAMFAFGKYLENLELGPDNFHLITRHKAFGILILMLIALRVLWRFISAPPDALPASRNEHLLARATHMGLYILMISTPLFGWIASSATGFSIPFFGLFDVPLLLGENEIIEKRFFALHGYSAMALIALSIAHLGAALYHHFVLGDETLKRMTR
jgi:cytochrome b561